MVLPQISVVPFVDAGAQAKELALRIGGKAVEAKRPVTARSFTRAPELIKAVIAGGNPEREIRTWQHAGDPFAAAAGGSVQNQRCEAEAVKERSAARGAHNQVAILRLADPGDVVLGKAIFDLPMLPCVLGQ